MMPEEIVHRMMENDRFSQWLGIQILEVKEGYCRLFMKIRKEMLNGFSIAHGGITYSLADSALAFASNSQGQKALSIETSIHHLETTLEGDEILAEAKKEYESEKFGHYVVHVYLLKNSEKKQLAFFKGIVYKTSRKWE